MLLHVRSDMTRTIYLLLAVTLAGCSIEHECDKYSDPPTLAANLFVATESADKFEQASAEWSVYGFDFTAVGECPAGKICSKFRIVDHVCAEWPDVPERAYGCAVELSGHSWVVDVRRDTDIRREALHEIGHVAGFGHVEGNYIMNAIVNSAEHLVDNDLSRPTR